MKKLLFLYFLSLCAIFTLTAQEHNRVKPLEFEAGFPERADLKPFEFEFGAGINFGKKWDEMNVEASTNFLFELRLNRPEPFDLGLQFKAGNFTHKIPDIVRMNSIFINPTLFFDYNKRFDEHTALFAGIGVGGSFIRNETYLCIDSYRGVKFDDHANHFAVTPRMGVFVMGRLRITAEYVFTARDYSHFNLNVGMIIGNSYKKKNYNGRYF
ncbi:MAG: hypothetical protein LBU80_02685 [Rikenellaceae bacterium]|jgi:hypothetical protein|nr:hypothetical protein [Rikenellaceae bacterium]